MLAAWPYLKITLGIVFLACCLTLPYLLFSLALSKKKLKLYIQQIRKKGEITKELNSFITAFDLLLAVNIFNPIPDRKKHSKYFKFKTVDSLEKHIRLLIKIVRPIALTTAVVAVLLIILLNIYGD